MKPLKQFPGNVPNIDYSLTISFRRIGGERLKQAVLRMLDKIQLGTSIPNEQLYDVSKGVYQSRENDIKHVSEIMNQTSHNKNRASKMTVEDLQKFREKMLTLKFNVKMHGRDMNR